MSIGHKRVNKRIQALGFPNSMAFIPIQLQRAPLLLPVIRAALDYNFSLQTKSV